jgi:hypothetical protein
MKPETHLIMIPIEQRQKAGLGACRSLHATETQIVSNALEVP